MNRHPSIYQCLLPVATGLLLAVMAGSLHALTVTRGPYLQLQTTNSIVVRWRTDQACVGRVFFGENQYHLTESVVATEPGVDHAIQITGLRPGTRYYYSLGGEQEGSHRLLSSAGPGQYFRTAPADGRWVNVNVWIIGDSGTADSDARRVRDAMRVFSNRQETDVWLMLGDNAYDSGTDEEYQEAVFDMYPRLLATTPLWPTIGNHDAKSAVSRTGTGPYYDIFSLPENGESGGLPSDTEAYYSFDFANIHFICLNSQDVDRSPEGAMMRWLENDLAANTRTWTIAYWHHPPYSKGSHDSDDPEDSVGRMKDMREIALPILEAGGVDLVFTGHSHSYERSHLLDGHYGASQTFQPFMVQNQTSGRAEETGGYSKSIESASHGGTVYVVAGSSGQTGGGDLDHPVMFKSLDVLGSVLLEVNGLRLDAGFVDDEGRKRDWFTMKKVHDSTSTFP